MLGPAVLPEPCPVCGSGQVAIIQYGLPAPSDELDQALARGDVVLGGCVIQPTAPDLQCRMCGHRWQSAGAPPGFDAFELSQPQADVLVNEYRLLVEGTRVAQCASMIELSCRRDRESGIYVWIMTDAGRNYRIYVGKTVSIALRAANYIGDFQPHSPNDYKLRIFAEFMQDILPQATLDLWFKAVPSADLTRCEKEAIRTFSPLLNGRLKPSNAARVTLERAFSDYYRSGFARALGLDG